MAAINPIHKVIIFSVITILLMLVVSFLFKYPQTEIEMEGNKFIADESGLTYVLPRDDIPAIYNPKFTHPGKDTNWLNNNDIVLGLVFDDEHRAYPLKILNWHEVVNDMISGEPVLITYSPVCSTALVYERTLDQQTLEFGVTGRLLNGCPILYDTKTDSYWSQVNGQSILGKYEYAKLNKLSADLYLWKDWKEKYPMSKVLKKHVYLQGKELRNYALDPYAEYMVSDQLLFDMELVDTRLPAKTLIYGLNVNGQERAYPKEQLIESGNISDIFAGETIKIVVDSELKSAQFFKLGQELKPIVPQVHYWFSWSAEFENTSVWSNL